MRSIIIIGLLTAIIAWTNTHWIAGGVPPTTTDSGFVGYKACASCHKDIVTSHLKTAHFGSSSIATAATIKGSFRNGRNDFVYNEHMHVLLEKKNGVFLQTAYFNDNVFEAEAFDVVIGSARKGQTYLYWDNARLFQLPISYYTPTDSWCNSPGYPTNLVYFNKMVPGQCMECHATSADLMTADNGAVTYDKNSIIYGIDCERCHGPGAQHVAWQSAHPKDTTAKYILNTKYLPRQRQLDACALCHSGFRKQFRPSFSFKVGDTLDKYSTAVYDTSATASLDVHGNQYGLLTSSKCFMNSELDCSSCHNVHVDEFGAMGTYSKRCQNCHNETTKQVCTFPPVKQSGFTANCIDCHMPALASNKIQLQLSGSAPPVHDLVRTHRIAIYPELSREWWARHH